MKKWIWVVVIIIAILIIVGFNSAPKNEETIKIGVIASLTGPGAYLGEQFVDGLQIALTDINNNGGIDGKKIILIIEDSQTDNTTALTAAKKLVEIDGVKIILGDSWNSTTLTVLPYTNEKKVILFSPNASLNAFTKDDYMFRLMPTTAELVKPLALYLKNAGVKTIAFARVNTAFTQEYYLDFKSEFENIGGSVIADEEFSSPGLDVRSELVRIKNTNPEAIFNIHNSGPSIGLLISQANQIGIKTKWLSTWATENGALLEQYPKEVEGIIYPFMYDESDSVISKNFANRVREMDKTADFYIASGYDILNIVSEVISETKSTDGDILKNSLLKIKNYEGASGNIGFDQNGDVSRNVFIKTVKDGQFVRMEQ
jgi:branched-chain amino acid transport system substrate-binding protein